MSKFLFFICLSFLSFFSGDTITNATSETIITEASDYYVYVHVSHRDGGNYSGAKVQGSVCGVIGGTTSVIYTDRKGNAKLTFSSNEALCKIFINGRTKTGRWRSGETVSFVD